MRLDQVQALVIQPLLDQATSTQVSSVVQTTSTSTRFPIVVTDPVTDWTPEGEEITPADSVLDELVCTPLKLAGLTIVSTELMEDSDPSALEVVGSGLVRDLQLRWTAPISVSPPPMGPQVSARWLTSPRSTAAQRSPISTRSPRRSPRPSSSVRN